MRPAPIGGRRPLLATVVATLDWLARSSPVSEFNWRALTVEEENRSAIYAETFPARLADALAESPDHQELLDAFGATSALEILATFAGAWGSLHQDARGHRWQYRSLVTETGTLLGPSLPGRRPRR